MAMNSAISVSKTSCGADPGGSAQVPKAVPPGYISAQILVPVTVSSLPKTLVPSGETRDIHRAGGRYLTLVGSNPLFHLPEDRWPHAVDTDAVSGIAASAAALVVKLTR